jgi:hypothetical protein
MMKITTKSSDGLLRIQNKTNTISLQIMFSELENYFQNCGDGGQYYEEEPAAHFISADVISDEDMNFLIQYLHSNDSINDESSGTGVCEGLFSTKLASEQVWWTVKNKSETTSLSLRQIDYDDFLDYQNSNNDSSDEYSIDFQIDTSQGIFIISDLEMNQLVEFFESEERLEHLKD